MDLKDIKILLFVFMETYDFEKTEFCCLILILLGYCDRNVSLVFCLALLGDGGKGYRIKSQSRLENLRQFSYNFRAVANQSCILQKFDVNKYY